MVPSPFSATTGSSPSTSSTIKRHRSVQDNIAKVDLATASEFSLPILDDCDDDDDDLDVYSTASGCYDDSSSKNGGTKRTRSTKGSDEAVNKIDSKEKRLVFWSKIFVFAVLAVGAGVLAWLTYWFISGEEEEDYQAQVSYKRV
jgi:hypothetical protein